MHDINHASHCTPPATTATWQESHRNWWPLCELLVFVLILRDLIHGIGNGQWTLTKPDRFIHLTFIWWHHSPSSSSCITNDGSLLQQTEPHHPFKTTSSSRAILRGLQWDLCWDPQETNQDLGFKISFKPKLVHL